MSINVNLPAKDFVPKEKRYKFIICIVAAVGFGYLISFALDFYKHQNSSNFSRVQILEKQNDELRQQIIKNENEKRKEIGSFEEKTKELERKIRELEIKNAKLIPPEKILEAEEKIKRLEIEITAYREREYSYLHEFKTPVEVIISPGDDFCPWDGSVVCFKYGGFIGFENSVTMSVYSSVWQRKLDSSRASNGSFDVDVRADFDRNNRVKTFQYDGKMYVLSVDWIGKPEKAKFCVSKFTSGQDSQMSCKSK